MSLLLCVFRVGVQDYAIDARRVEELVGPHPRVEVLTWRQLELPVTDLAALLTPDATAPPPTHPRFIVCRVGMRRLALAVTEVRQVLRVTEEAVRPSPPAPFVLAALGDIFLLDLLSLLKASVSAR